MASQRKEWKAIRQALPDDFKGVDAVILVKRTPQGLVKRVHDWGGPFIYDALDFWPQQLGHQPSVESREDVHSFFRNYFEQLNADMVISVNSTMQRDLMDIVKKSECIPHHSAPSLFPFDKRALNKNAIWYWGMPHYLGEWHTIIADTCKKLDKTFIISSTKRGQELKGSYGVNAAANIAVRGGHWGSWLSRRWKSGVKGATAQALRVPFIAWPEHSYIEQHKDNLYEFTDAESLELAIQRAFESGRPKMTNSCSLETSSDLLEKILEKSFG